MNLQESINRIKQVMGMLNEQSRVITSGSDTFETMDNYKEELGLIIKPQLDKVKQYYINHFNNPKTISKFKNKRLIGTIKQFISTINYDIYVKFYEKLATVTSEYPSTIFLNVHALFDQTPNDFIKGNPFSETKTDWKSEGTKLYDTIFHEAAHLIQHKMIDLDEKTMNLLYDKNKVFSDNDNYVESVTETYARIQRLRYVLGLNPKSNGNEIKNKIIELIKLKKIIFPNVEITSPNRNMLKFTKSNVDYVSAELSSLWGFYYEMKIDGTINDDISALFAKFSYAEGNSVFLDFDKLGKMNISVVDNTKKTNATTQPT